MSREGFYVSGGWFCSWRVVLAYILPGYVSTPDIFTLQGLRGYRNLSRSELSWVLFLLVFERIRDMSKRYSQDFKDRAVRLLCDRLAADGSCSQWRAVNEIAPKLGVANESLRRWYEQHLVNTGERQGMTREEHEEVKRLKREVAELRRANEILKTASAFFAAELDRPAR